MFFSRPVGRDREGYSWVMTPSCLWRGFSLFYTKLKSCARNSIRQKLTLLPLFMEIAETIFSECDNLCLRHRNSGLNFSFKPCFIIYIKMFKIQVWDHHNWIPRTNLRYISRLITNVLYIFVGILTILQYNIMTSRGQKTYRSSKKIIS